MTAKELEEKNQKMWEIRLNRGDTRTDEEVKSDIEKARYLTKKQGKRIIKELMKGPEKLMTEWETCEPSTITREEMIEHVRSQIRSKERGYL